MEYYYTIRCSVEGCTESQLYTFTSRKKYNAFASEHPSFKCLRHDNPEQVLSETNKMTQITYECLEIKGKNYWNKKGMAGGYGFIGGDGYKSWADDFPIETKLVITAKVILPL